MIVQLLLVLLIQTAAAETPNPLEELYAEAIVAMEAGDWTEALSKFEAVLLEDPSHLSARFNLAVSLSEDGQTDRALTTYRSILAADPTVFEARMNLAILLHENGMSEDAIREFSDAALLRPEDPLPALYRAQLLDQSDRENEAIQAYLVVLDIEPKLVEAHERLGFIYRDLDDGDQAIRELIAAIRLGSVDPAVFVAAGDIESDRENLGAAREYYERADELAPGDTDIRLRLARVLRNQEQLFEAISILEELENSDPALAEAYMANAMYEEAAAVFERLTQRNPDISDYWYMLGRAYYEMEISEQAELAFRRAMNIEPERVEGWGTLAAIYLEREDWANAGVMLLQYVTLKPDHAPSHFAVALCFDNLGDFERALAHYNRFVELDDGSDDVRSFQVRQRVESLERILIENK
jgi:tetratricopeptide (TPR) repeat protein